jgi:hypothetical protein
MSPRDWFILGARLFGLWVLYNGVSWVCPLFERMFGIEHPDHYRYAPGTLLATSLWHFFFAAILLFKTETLARMICDPKTPA